MLYRVVFIPIILIVLSLGMIGSVILRKIPQLSVLDVENIPEVKEEKKKEALLKKRVEMHAEIAYVSRRCRSSVR